MLQVSPPSIKAEGSYYSQQQQPAHRWGSSPPRHGIPATVTASFGSSLHCISSTHVPSWAAIHTRAGGHTILGKVLGHAPGVAWPHHHPIRESGPWVHGVHNTGTFLPFPPRVTHLSGPWRHTYTCSVKWTHTHTHTPLDHTFEWIFRATYAFIEVFS